MTALPTSMYRASSSQQTQITVPTRLQTWMPHGGETLQAYLLTRYLRRLDLLSFVGIRYPISLNMSWHVSLVSGIHRGLDTGPVARR